MVLKNKKGESIPKKGVLDGISEFLKHRVGINPKEYKKSALLIFFLIIAIIFGLIKYFSNISRDVYQQKASISESGVGVQIIGDENIVHIGESQEIDSKIDFSDGKWEVGLGNLSKWVGNPGRFDLPHGERSGLLKYMSPLEITDAFFEIRFKSHSSGESINFVVTFPRVYEIVVGDKDLKTITLKKSSASDSRPREFVKEWERDIIRPQLKRDIIRDTEVELNIKQEMLPNGNMWLQIDIKYWHERATRKEKDTFSYEFEPPPGIDDLMYLHIGVLRDETTDINNSFELLKPIPDINF